MLKKISIVIPALNEEKNIPLLAHEVTDAFKSLPDYVYEIIFINDGSFDGSQAELEKLSAADSQIKLIELSRNFGKEAATSAGIALATGEAIIVMDADLQHPPELIKCFLDKWEAGAEAVFGLRQKNQHQDNFRQIGSWLYYRIMALIGEENLPAYATDFLLIDRRVAEEFKKMTERNRLTRGMLAWLGFKRDYVEFSAPPRGNGRTSYSLSKLCHLALSSFVANSLFPLKLAGYLGLLITFFSGFLGVIIFFEQYIFSDIWQWGISGSAKLALLNMFLIGIVLSCLGLIALYIGNINSDTTGRPLYIIRRQKNF